MGLAKIYAIVVVVVVFSFFFFGVNYSIIVLLLHARNACPHVASCHALHIAREKKLIALLGFGPKYCAFNYFAFYLKMLCLVVLVQRSGSSNWQLPTLFWSFTKAGFRVGNG